MNYITSKSPARSLYSVVPEFPEHPTSTFGRPRSSKSILKFVNSISQLLPGNSIEKEALEWEFFGLAVSSIFPSGAERDGLCRCGTFLFCSTILRLQSRIIIDFEIMNELRYMMPANTVLCSSTGSL